MNALFTRSLLVAALSLTGCDQMPSQVLAADASVVLSPWNELPQIEAETLRFVPAETTAGADLFIAASESRGLLVLDGKGAELARLPGNYSALDSRKAGDSLIVASINNSTQQATLVGLDLPARKWGHTLALPARDFAVAGLCLYRDEANNLFLFLVGEEGRGEQWLVGTANRLSASARQVRRLPLPPQAEYCQADDSADRLFVNEENLGLWAYPAHPEAGASRVPVDMRAPYGRLKTSAGAMASVPGGLLVLDPSARALHLYQQQGEHWRSVGPVQLPGVKEPEHIAVQSTAAGLQVLLQDDASGHFYQGLLNWQPSPVSTAPVLPNVAAIAQTEPVGRQGDAADDPAIWVHPTQPSLSRVLGTNKKQGLLSYDLNGKLLKDLPVGRLNNVDLRADFSLAGRTIDLAVASNRDNNSISLFAIDRSNGTISTAGEIPTPLKEIYGICLFQPQPGELYAFANDKDGSFLQYRLSDANGKLAGKLVRRFAVASQPEGCVADDQQQRLFIGEEDVGVWAVDARADGSTELSSVLAVGDVLKADVEGLGLYQAAKHSYLLVSSQGNDSYVVLDAMPPYAIRGALRVGLNGALGIDGASETDGLEVTSANLGGPWSKGMLVVQDGRKRMPETTQNFKFVAWSQVAEALHLQ
ncbi:phytase [Pseudomonas sp. S9]|uniref:phytase n=1 Tax=Pseudomonas sp. S9 TaxID=686578 RepID=UPI00025573D8|nr:phytase [Pseudomonas sp. S9]